MSHEPPTRNEPRPPRRAVAWLIAAALLPPACLLSAGPLHEGAIFVAFGLTLALSVIGLVAIIRRRRFDRPALCVVVASVLFAWAALFALAGHMGLSIAMENSHGVTCRSRQKKLGIAIWKYAEAHAGAYPVDLQTLLDEGYVTDPATLICPKSDDEPSDDVSADQWSSYAYVQVRAYGDIASPGDVPIAWDKRQQHIVGSCNVLYADIHVSTAGYVELAERLERSRPFYVTQPEMPPVPGYARSAVEEAIRKVRSEMKKAPPPPARD